MQTCVNDYLLILHDLGQSLGSEDFANAKARVITAACMLCAPNEGTPHVDELARLARHWQAEYAEMAALIRGYEILRTSLERTQAASLAERDEANERADMWQAEAARLREYASHRVECQIRQGVTTTREDRDGSGEISMTTWSGARCTCGLLPAAPESGR